MQPRLEGVTTQHDDKFDNKPVLPTYSHQSRINTAWHNKAIRVANKVFWMLFIYRHSSLLAVVNRWSAHYCYCAVHFEDRVRSLTGKVMVIAVAAAHCHGQRCWWWLYARLAQLSGLWATSQGGETSKAYNHTYDTKRLAKVCWFVALLKATEPRKQVVLLLLMCESSLRGIYGLFYIS
jgi:hypothetical protein